MIADVKYNDLRGTAAADVSDFCNTSLQEYLSSNYESYDSDRYDCKGCTIWISGQSEDPCANLTFVCWDKQTRKYIPVRFTQSFPLKEVFQIFKRFEVVLGNNFNEVKVDEQDAVTIDNSGCVD